MPPQAAVCLVTHNSRNVIGAALDAVLAQQGADFEVRVWDNASRDSTRSEVERRAGVILHPSDINLGFCAGNNRLIALTQTPYLLFLNPDTEMQPGCLARLVETLCAAPPDVAGGGPKMLRPDKSADTAILDSTGIVLSKHNLSPYDRDQGEPDRGQYDHMTESFGPSFACALLRREALAALSLDGQALDEEYFAYYEDVDFAWRAQRLGWRFFYEPRAVCLHRRGHPHDHGPTLAARAFVNRYLLLIANEDGRDGLGYLWRLIPRELARLLWLSLSMKGFSIAWRMLCAGWRRAWDKRRQIQTMVGVRG